MPNATANLTLNLTTAIGDTFKNTIGQDAIYGSVLIGGLVVIFFLIWIFKARLGFFGTLVLIPPLVILLSNSGLLPPWLTPLVWFVVGIGWAMIILRLVREA